MFFNNNNFRNPRERFSDIHSDVFGQLKNLGKFFFSSFHRSSVTFGPLGGWTLKIFFRFRFRRRNKKRRLTLFGSRSMRFGKKSSFDFDRRKTTFFNSRISRQYYAFHIYAKPDFFYHVRVWLTLGFYFIFGGPEKKTRFPPQKTPKCISRSLPTSRRRLKIPKFYSLRWIKIYIE